METKEKAICSICGEPMPEGEEMFNYHGFSCPCPKPPLKQEVAKNLHKPLVSGSLPLSESEIDTIILDYKYGMNYTTQAERNYWKQGAKWVLKELRKRLSGNDR